MILFYDSNVLNNWVQAYVMVIHKTWIGNGVDRNWVLY